MAACCRTPRLTTDRRLLAWIGSRRGIVTRFGLALATWVAGSWSGPGLIDALSIAVCRLLGLVYRDNEMHLACT